MAAAVHGCVNGQVKISGGEGAGGWGISRGRHTWEAAVKSRPAGASVPEKVHESEAMKRPRCYGVVRVFPPKETGPR